MSGVAAVRLPRTVDRRRAAPAVSLLHVSVELDAPSVPGAPVEALLAAVASCLLTNLRWIAEAARVDFERFEVDLAAARADDAPAINLIRVELTLETSAPAERVIGLVHRALRAGTVIRTVARAVELSVVVRLNGVLRPIATNLRLR